MFTIVPLYNTTRFRVPPPLKSQFIPRLTYTSSRYAIKCQHFCTSTAQHKCSIKGVHASVCGLSQQLHHKRTHRRLSLFLFLFSLLVFKHLRKQTEVARETKRDEERGRLDCQMFLAILFYLAHFLPPCSLICFPPHFNNCPQSCYPFHSMFSHPPLLLSSHPHPSFPALAFRCGVYVKASIIFRKKWLCFAFAVWKKDTDECLSADLIRHFAVFCACVSDLYFHFFMELESLSC